MKVVALVPAAGIGVRMGHAVRKQFLELQGLPILVWTLRRLAACEPIEEVIPIVSADMVEYCAEEIVDRYEIHKVKRIVVGGHERQESVWNGLHKVGEEYRYVMVHDGVRPFVSDKLLLAALREAGKHDGVVVGYPVKDTMKDVDKTGFVEKTLRRNHMWAIQTPQIFRREVIWDAYMRASEAKVVATDDAALVEWAGYKVKVLEGEHENIKITTPFDLVMGEAILASRKGDDAHA
ncbi:MAG: 2-C-methyl-D-erythritol 4-phosphate cytidylyltransferase [Nitrospirota bacterium]|nr:2-C-methyl-D-erythritol 4-phosphate cytidylyltransferase [Nitrospirota bacterium]